MNESKRSFLKKILISLSGLILLDSFWLESFFIELKKHYYKDASDDSHNLKILQISDLHINSVNWQLKRLTKKINELKPDLILFTGDSVDNENNLDIFNDFLKGIEFDFLKVAILGNWEYWGKVDLSKLHHIYTSNNCKLLINESIQFTVNNKKISITGLDDYLGGRPDFEKAMKYYQKSDYHILLNHCPQYYDKIIQYEKKETIDFVLSGHTHGGQVNIFGYIPFLPQGSGNYIKGWYTEKVPNLYVSKGIGTSMIPIRFGSRSEVSIFHL